MASAETAVASGELAEIMGMRISSKAKETKEEMLERGREKREQRERKENRGIVVAVGVKCYCVELRRGGFS